MATKLEHIYAIQNIINKGAKSDDARISNRLVEHFLNASRSILIKQKLDKYQPLSNYSYQSICIELEETANHNCPCVTEDLGCKVLKSKVDLPSEITKRWKSSMIVKFLDGRLIDKISKRSNEYSKYSLTKNTTALNTEGWLIEDNKLVILNNPNNMLQIVTATAAWSDPGEVSDYGDCSTSTTATTCIDERTAAYPIDPDLVIPMYKMTLELLGIAYKYPEDNENNARSNETANDKEV